MNQSFDDSNIDLDIDSLSEPMGFADGGEAEAMHLTPYGETNQESMDYQDAHSMPPMYAQGGDVEIGDYSIPTFRDRTASQMLQAFADGGAVQGRPVGGMFDLGVGNPADRGVSVGQSYAVAPGGIGQTKYNKNISDLVTANIHRSPQVIASEAQKWGVSPGDITTALGGQTLESRFRQEPSYQQTTTASGQMKDIFGPATMLTGGTGTGANWVAPTVTSRPRTLVDVTPGLSASQQHARNLVQGDTALNDAFTRTGLAKDPATYYDWQQQMNSGAVTPDQLKSKFDPIAYERRVKEAYGNIGRQGMGNDLSSFHPTSMGEMFKAYMNPNATAEDVQRITDQYSGSYGTNWNADTANKARAEVIIPSLQAQDYYKRNSDVSAAFDAALKADPNQDYVGFAKNHYNKYGKKEGRTWNSDITVGKYKAPEAEDFAKIDPGGYNWWMNQLKEGKISGADFDKMFYGATATYAGPYQDLYKSSMDKANELIKARGLNIATGATQTLPGVTGYKYPNQNALVDSINALYQTNLSRDAEPGGMTFWLNQFGADGKISPEEATLFKQSAQAERTARKMAQGGYVKKPEGAASYRMAAPVRLALGGSISRSPFRSQNEDSDYAKFMMKQQETGGPTQFAEPPPAPKTVTDLYRDVLGRAPDEGGAAYWAERFGSEVDPEEAALFTQAAQPEIAARAPAPEPAAPAYTGIFGGMGVRGRSSSIPNPAGNSIFNRYGIQPNATNTDGQVSGGGGGDDSRLANAVINAGLSYAIGPTYDFANAGRRFIQGDVGGAATSLVSGLTGGISGIGKSLGFAEGGEVAETPPPAQEPSSSTAADALKKLGLSVARGAPQIVTGAVDLAALPFTATGMIKPEDVVLSTEYLTKKGLLPPPQKGVANETMELLSSAVNPAGAVKGSAAMALGMMKNATGKTLAKQLDLPFEQATKGPAESPMIRAYTGHTREIVGPYDVTRASKSADMGPGLYLTDDAEYASRSATKRVGRGIPESDAAPAVYPVDIEKSKILMHDKQYPREVLDKLRKFSGKVEDTPGATVSGEYIYEQIRKANIPKTMMPGVFKLMGFQGAEFLPGGVSGGKSYVVYDTADTAKGAYTKKKFKDGGEATSNFIKKSSKRR